MICYNHCSFKAGLVLPKKCKYHWNLVLEDQTSQRINDLLSLIVILINIYDALYIAVWSLHLTVGSYTDCASKVTTGREEHGDEYILCYKLHCPCLPFPSVNKSNKKNENCNGFPLKKTLHFLPWHFQCWKAFPRQNTTWQTEHLKQNASNSLQNFCSIYPPYIQS